MAVVELHLSALPAHVRTSRLVVVAAARRAGLPDELLDELRLAVGEACSRAVVLHTRHAPDVPVRLTVLDDPSGLTVSVTDSGPAAGPAPTDLEAGLLEPDGGDPDVALAVLSGLLDDVRVEPSSGGTTITMRWPLPFAQSGPGSTALA